MTSNNVLGLVDSTTRRVTPVDIIASDRQEGIPVNYRSPFSIAAGIEYTISDRTTVHLAMEWFAPVSTYAVMQPESGNFILNNPIAIRHYDSAELLRVYDSMKSVFNVGVAVEHKMNDKLTGYAAIRTDFSNANYDDIHGLSLGYTDFNIYHYTLGASLNVDDTFIFHRIGVQSREEIRFPQDIQFPFRSG